MPTVADELVIKVSADDQLTGVMRGLSTLLTQFGQQLQQLGNLGAGALAPTVSSANAATSALQDLGAQGAPAVAAVDEAAQKLNASMFELGAEIGKMTAEFMEQALDRAAKLEDQMATLERISGLTGDGMTRLRNELIGLGDSLRRPIEQLAEAAVQAARLGLKGNDLIEFVGIVDKFAIATGTSAEQGAIAMANMRNIFSDVVGDNIKNLDRFASMFVRLDNVSASTAAKMVEGMRRVTAATELGFKPAFIGAMIAQLTAMGGQAQLSGTQVNSSMTFLAKNVAKVAKVLKLSVAETTALIDRDAQGALRRLLESLHKIPSNVVRLNTATEIFGRVGAKAMGKLSQHLGELDRLTRESEDAFNRSIDTEKSLAFAMGTTNAAVAKLHNSYYSLSVLIGDKFLPAKKAVMNALQELVLGIRGLVGEMSGLELAFTALGAVMATSFLFTGGAGLGAMFGGITSGLAKGLGFLSKYIPLFVSLGNVLKPLISSVGGFMGLIGRGALLAGVITNIDAIVMALRLVWDTLSEISTGTLDLIREPFEYVRDILSSVMTLINVVGIYVGKTIGKVVGWVINQVATAVEELAKATSIGKYIEPLVQPLRDAATGAEAAGERFGNMFTSLSGAKEAASALLNLGTVIKEVNTQSEEAMGMGEKTKVGLDQISGKLLRLKLETKLTSEEQRMAANVLKESDVAWARLNKLLSDGIAPRVAILMLGKELSAGLQQQSEGAGAAAGAMDKLTAAAQVYKDKLEAIRNLKIPQIMDASGAAVDKNRQAVAASAFESGKLAREFDLVRQKLMELTGAYSWEAQLKATKLDPARKSEYTQLVAAGKALQAKMALQEQNTASLARAAGITREDAEAIKSSTAVQVNSMLTLQSTGDETDKLKEKTKALAIATKDAATIMQDRWKAGLEFVAKIMDSTEKQITGTMTALGNSVSAISQSITGMAPVMQTLLDPTRPFSQFASAAEQKILRQFELQEEMSRQQALVNAENLENLRLRNAILRGGPQTQKVEISVSGIPDAQKALVKSVMDGIFVQAKKQGGELCC